jgi:hypothetical protein
MSRTLLGWFLMALVAAGAGCTMCATPYDECGPVLTGDCASCRSNVRRGSVLSAGAESSGDVVRAEAESAVEQTPPSSALHPIPDTSLEPPATPVPGTNGPSQPDGWRAPAAAPKATIPNPVR